MSDFGRYRKVPVIQWHDSRLRRLNDGARIVRFYVSAGPQTTSVGCFRLSTAVAVEDLGGTPDQFEEHLHNVCEAFTWAWDPLARVIWIRDWFECNPPASPNVVASWAKLIKNVPPCAVRDEAVASISASLKELPASFREPWADLSKSFRRTETKPEIRPEINQGSGNRGSGIQRIREQALRGGAENGKSKNPKPYPIPDARLVNIARDVIRDAPRETTTDYLVDVFLNECRQRQVPANRQLAVVALAHSQQGQTA